MAHSFLLLSILQEAQYFDMAMSPRQFKNRLSFSTLNDGNDYIQSYRLSEELVESLHHEIEPYTRITVKKGRGLSTRVKILCALSFLASGGYQRIVGKNDRLFISQASASRCISEIVEALCQPAIVKKYIRFPQNSAERQLIKKRFYEKFKIPGVVGCIDGTYVTLVRPTEHGERFYCHKGNHARNVMLITDADSNILHVDASYGGATHDNVIFNNSEIKTQLEKLNNTGEVAYLLGDSEYTQRDYTMTPIPNVVDNTKESYYNKIHAAARNTVERTIGELKGRFRCLLAHRVLRYHPDTVAKIIVACCVLHNICNHAGIPAPVLDPEECDIERTFSVNARSQQIHTVEESMIATGHLARSELVDRLWNTRM